MLFLLDANVLIDADRDYYPLARVPEFWDWLQFQGEQGRVRIPIEIYEEIVDGDGELVEWLKRPEARSALVLSEESDPARVSEVVAVGYAPDLTDDELVRVGRDPFLIAYATVAVEERCVVTTESSRPSRQRANRHVPDVCIANGVHYCNTFELTRRLNFSTSWRR